MGKLDGKNIIITGAASGLGKQEALRCAMEGANLALCDLKEDELEETKKLCEEYGNQVVVMKVNVCNYNELEAFAKLACETYKRIDCLVNNVHAVRPLARIIDSNVEDFEIELKSSVICYYHMMKLCFPYMKDHEGAGASIVNFGSASGVGGYKLQGQYAAAKEAVRGLSRTAAREFGPHNIRVNVLTPGGLTENTKKGYTEQCGEAQDWIKEAFSQNCFERVGSPYDDVAPAVVFLASDDSRWVTGCTLKADGGCYICD